ncbi:Centromere protein O [Merluccius polli]|uniref:Centromere protein O n=1 Tax=Merluccius polli TaxID=89951 RepID=A0AA47P778_MERPO|nr:Centromere protein O [Merluccius polli]
MLYVIFEGVLGHLSALETQARRRQEKPPQQSRLEELKAQVDSLVVQRDQLKAEMQAEEKLRDQDQSARDGGELGDGSDGSDGSVNSQLLRTCLHAHHLIGGYDVVKTRQGKGVCVSIATSYEGVYLERYTLEIDVAPKLRVARHDIPPFVALPRLVERGGPLQTQIRGFLGALSRHLDAYAGRKQQLKLVKEQHKSVEVMESNALCSILVLMLTVPHKNVAVLCKLDYSDHTRYTDLPETAQWKQNCSLLKETPLHKALAALIQTGDIK